jgi:AraC family ethanolamine operon transcriptional activator
VVSHAFSSIEALQRALVQPQFEVFQVHPGRFETTIVRAVPRPGLAASLGESAAAVRSRGVLAPDATDVVVVIDAPGHAYFNGIALKPGLVLVMPAGLEFEGHAPAGFRWANLHLTAEDLLRATRALTGRGFELPAREILVRPALPADEAALLALHEAGQASPGASTGPTAESVVETWLGIVARALAGAGPDDLSGARRLGDRHRVFLAAEAHLRSRVTEPVYMSELCHATGVSERTLEYVFRERVGLTPIAYLANLRLNRPGCARGGARLPGPVATVARRFGFLHLGRFAARYRAVPGVASTTLRRPSWPARTREGEAALRYTPRARRPRAPRPPGWPVRPRPACPGPRPAAPPRGPAAAGHSPGYPGERAESVIPPARATVL